MFQRRLLLLIPVVALCRHVLAADAPQQESACDRAMRNGSESWRPTGKDADLDGRGACRLADGYVLKGGSNAGAGVPSEAWGRDKGDPGAHRFSDEDETHGLHAGWAHIGGEAQAGARRQSLLFEQVGRPSDLFAAAVAGPALEESTTLVAGAPSGQPRFRGDAAFIAATPLPNVGMTAPQDGAVTSRTGLRTLDNGGGIVAAPVPEPTTWAMLLAGSATLTLLRRRGESGQRR